MSFSILPISTSEQLTALLPLFTQSYGAEVTWGDEHGYFQQHQPQDWWAAYLDEQPVGFVRHFAVTATLTEGELYLAPEYAALEAHLLAHFCHHLQYPGALRFCFPASDSARIAIYRKTGFEREQRYLYYVLPSSVKGQIWPEVTWAQLTDLQGVETALTHFGNLSKAQLSNAITQQQVVVLKHHGNIAGAAYLQPLAQGYEILELAVLPDLQGQKLGRQLMEGLIALWKLTYPKQSLSLKVEASLKPAVGLYQSVGLQHMPAKDMLWLYRKPPQTGD